MREAMDKVMHQAALPPLRTWLVEPFSPDVAAAIERLRCAPGVAHVAVMPDVHLATDVCIGVALATEGQIYPQAVGGDIGCGMLAVAVDAPAEALADPKVAGRMLGGLGRAVPARRRNRRELLQPPPEVDAVPLSDPRLDALRRSEGALAFATLGSGNHFLELQADEAAEGKDGPRLWLMVHSGSRALGPAIRDHHLARATPVGNGLRALAAESPDGEAYRADVAWARRFADASRRAMAEQVGALCESILGADLDWSTAISTDHNHVALEEHFGRPLWIHRKGAMRARAGELGVLPGSMGEPSFHVEGRGHADALCSAAHGAGRALSRGAARERISARELLRQMQGIWFDYRMAETLREEAPDAYKDIEAVLRAQRELVKARRRLRPVLCYKGV